MVVVTSLWTELLGVALTGYDRQTTLFVGDRVESWSWSSSMAQAVPTLQLTLGDDDYSVRRSPVLDRQGDEVLDRGVTCVVAGAVLELAAVDPQGRQVTVTLEPRHVARLKRQTTRRSFREGAYTRTQALRTLVSEVPGVQLRTTSRGEATAAARERTAERTALAGAAAEAAASAGEASGPARPGIHRGEDLTVKGAPATSAQRAMASAALEVAADLRAGPKATKALVEALIVESQLRRGAAVYHRDLDSEGPLQVRASTAAGMRAQGRKVDTEDVRSVARLFLQVGFYGRGGAIDIARRNPTWTAGQVAQDTQGSGVPTAYDQVSGEADAFMHAYDGGASAGTTARPRADVELGTFGRGADATATDGEPESTWQVGLRFAEELRFAFYSYFLPVVVFADERDLLQQRPRYVVRPHDDVADWVDGGWDSGHGVDRLQLQMRLGDDPGALRAGDVVVVRDAGAQGGRYLVQDASLTSQDPTWRATLRRARDPKTPTIATKQAPSADGSRAAGNASATPARASDPIAELKRVARRVSSARAPYEYGGGHRGEAIGALKDSSPLDCSSGLSYILHETSHAWFQHPTAITSSGFASWGSPGPGERLTIWWNAGHVFLLARDADGSRWGIDTGGGLAPHYVEYPDSYRSTAGFNARHLKGL